MSSSMVVPTGEAAVLPCPETLANINTQLAAAKSDIDGIGTTANLASTTPAAVGTAGAVGVGTTAARADHVHADNSRQAAGAALTNADATVQVSGGYWYTLPAATLSADHTVTLATTGAVAGDQITITRLDATAHAYTVIDGGTGTPNLFVMAASKLGCAVCQFDGTNWKLKTFGVQ